MEQTIVFNKELISRYNLFGPRYTSYPTATQFDENFGIKEYHEVVTDSNEILLPKPLSLYFHLPFCNTVCFYCACNKVITANRNRAAPYLKDLHKEISLQGPLFDRDRVVKQLHWGGGTPTFISHDQMSDLMRHIRDNFALLDDDTGEYSIEIDPREIKPETVSLLRNLGFNRMSIGIQDFDISVQKAVNREQSYEQTRQVFDEARKRNFHSINVDLIYGLPKQTVRTFCNTINKIIEMSPDRIAIYNYAHMPRLFKTQRQINEEDLPEPGEKLEILGESIKSLTDAGYIYIGMDHFAKPDDELAVAQRKGNLYRNFQGYSTNADCDVIGFGVTAISKISNSYSQNIRTIDDYKERLEGNNIPVYRGYKLNHDDELRRKVITQLICHFQLDFDEIEDLFRIEFKDYFSSEIKLLADMEKDELLKIEENRIIVLPAGRFLIRNICSTFDKYYDKKSNKNTYSKMI
ncbi:MAG: oxygen-independent coproporphyrinogen III oxidase [Proteobacteria bacterium]|nr:oxygen-independent coproporphyrinogen III oxidase [Pseudomonadota bacterium]NOG59336.1 oxygen-independent coproporphyrinogen III oxidase [Pseudomonadota bacterium]